MEVYAAGRKLAKKFGVEFSDKRVKLDQPVQYGGFVKLETGTWAIVSQGKEPSLAQSITSRNWSAVIWRF